MVEQQLTTEITTKASNVYTYEHRTPLRSLYQIFPVNAVTVYDESKGESQKVKPLNAKNKIKLDVFSRRSGKISDMAFLA